jgi:hypothetical protein
MLTAVERVGARDLIEACDPNVNDAAIDDLLTPDSDTHRAYVQYADGARKVSAFGIRSIPSGTAGDDSLCFEIVEFLTAGRWLMVVWHDSDVFIRKRARDSEPSDPGFRDELISRVEARWRSMDGRSPGDLAVLFLHELGLTFSHGKKSLWTWLNDWETEFFEGRDSSTRTLLRLDKELGELHRVHSQFRRRLSELNVPKTLAGERWFADVSPSFVVTAQEADDLIDRSLDSLREYSQALQQALSLSQSHIGKRQLEVAQDFQRTIEVITAVVVVPTLVAGVYGANTRLPGQQRWSGFELMLAVMIIGAVVAIVTLRLIGRRHRGSHGLDFKAAPDEMPRFE